MSGASGPQDLSAVADEQVSKDRLSLAKAAVLELDAQTRKSTARWMMSLFGISNVVVLAMVAGLIWQDNRLLADKLIQSEHRTVTAAVVMALIAGTTTQLGALALIIGKYLFPSREP